MNGGETQPVEQAATKAVMGMASKVVVSVLSSLLVAACLWLWRLDSRIGKLEQNDAAIQKLWKAASQNRDAINDDRAAAGKPLLKWNLTLTGD